MKKYFRLFVVLALLPAFGWGCLRVGPRVVQAPQVQPQQKRLVDSKGTNQAAKAEDEEFEDASSSTAPAYLELDGGAAKIERSGFRIAAADSMEIESGDRIIVSSSTVHLVYPNAGMAELEPGTDVVLLTDEKQSGIFMDLRLEAGKVWTRFERLLGVDEEYSVTANGVVATVRGTAFGIGVDGEGVDLQVADHTVEVSTEIVSTSTVPLKISAGEGLKIVTKGLLLKDIKLIQSAVRQLSVAEKLEAGFRFGVAKILEQKLARPSHPVRLKVPASMPPELLPLRQKLIERSAAIRSGTFVAPTRAPSATETAPVQVMPRIQGPRG